VKGAVNGGVKEDVSGAVNGVCIDGAMNGAVRRSLEESILLVVFTFCGTISLLYERNNNSNHGMFCRSKASKPLAATGSRNPGSRCFV